MCRARCVVCDEKALLETCYCNSCQRSFSLCVKCEVLKPDYRQPEPSYCPQCSEKLRDGDPVATNYDGVPIRSVI